MQYPTPPERIADRTVADEYFAVSEKVEALYDHGSLPADAEGTQMLKLRREMHSRMLGNGHCARPVEMDCHFETSANHAHSSSPPSNSAPPSNANETTPPPKDK